jgi:hypothetical protein
MRLTILVFFFFLCHYSYALELPTDSAILKTIFGKYDKGGKTFTRGKTEEEKEHEFYLDKIKYHVSYKINVTVNNRNLLLVIADAIIMYQHGHSWGYRNYYYLENSNDSLKLIKSIVDGEETLIGDLDDFEILEIGKNKKALRSTFSSSGNWHYELAYSFYHVSLDEISFLFGFEMEYSNEAWNLAKSEDAPCFAESRKSTYEIIKSNKEWYDVKVREETYSFSNGCKGKILESKKNTLYTFDGTEYKESLIN